MMTRLGKGSRPVKLSRRRRFQKLAARAVRREQKQADKRDQDIASAESARGSSDRKA
jgi:hypothetical protein